MSSRNLIGRGQLVLTTLGIYRHHKSVNCTEGHDKSTAMSCSMLAQVVICRRPILQPYSFSYLSNLLKKIDSRGRPEHVCQMKPEVLCAVSRSWAAVMSCELKTVRQGTRHVSVVCPRRRGTRSIRMSFSCTPYIVDAFTIHSNNAAVAEQGVGDMRETKLN